VQLFVKNSENRTIVVPVKLSTTVQGLKDEIWDREGIPPQQQRLIWGCKELHGGLSHLTIAELGMQDGSALTLAVRILGRIGTLWFERYGFCARTHVVSGDQSCLFPCAIARFDCYTRRTD